MIPSAHIGGLTVAPVQLIPLLLLAVAYVRRTSRLAADGRPAPVWRQACFGAGLAVIVFSLVSPLAQLNRELFLAHMSQHLLLGDVAPILLVLGLTGPIVAPVLRLPLAGGLRFLANPLVALPLWIANLYVWHLPVLYEATLTSEYVHAAQHACFVGFGILVWMPLLGPLPKPEWFGYLAKFGYILAFRFGGAVLGNILIWTGTEIYPAYGKTDVAFGISGVEDQGIGGSIMMMEGVFITLGLLAWLLLDFARSDEATQELLDLAQDEGVALDRPRARRAVAAGRADELRQRISHRAHSARRESPT